MDRMDFTQAVARTRVLETRLLSRARIERMIEAEDIEGVIKILGETEYTNVLGDLNRPEEYETVLSAELKRIYKLTYDMVKDKRVVDLLALKYDYHNLKVLVKERLLEKDLSKLYIQIGTSDFEKLKSNYLSRDLREIDPRFREALEAVDKDFEINKDPQRIDIIMDRYYYEHFYDLAKETEIPLFINYVEDLIDFTNIKTLIRCKRQKKGLGFLNEALLPKGKIEIDQIQNSLKDSLEDIMERFKDYKISPEVTRGLKVYEETGSLSEFERQSDNYLMGLNKPSKNIHFGPEPIFSYIIAKETEIKILRIIMVSKINNIAPDNVRERLSDLYV